MILADRLGYFRSNVFDAMDRVKATVAATGQSIVDLSLGSADLPVAPHILRAIEAALQDPSTYGYQLFASTAAFRMAVATWYERRFGLKVDPEREVLTLIGSQEGTAHLPLAVMNPREYALVLDPGYPSHVGGVYLAGGQVYPLPLRAENQFLPDLEAVPLAVREQAKLLILSYPHNPTAAVAPLAFFEEAVTFCDRHGIILVHDFPYVDLVFDRERAPSIFEVDRDRQVGIEFYSLSKSYNMGGFRIGFAIGRADCIAGLRQVKSVIDFNQYAGILRGAIAALTEDQACVRQTCETFRTRRDAFVQALADHGWFVPLPPATMYVWAQLPPPWHQDSLGFCQSLVKATGIAAAPGSGFGQGGEGYVRFALVRDRPCLEIAAAHIAAFTLKEGSLL
ncbi:succinyldiaminopimelate aminotransferase [Parathermosynechococcus lividus PCC 6715]|uniref:Aminotransferase n=1 Tax=Parathermosynechococcus lividus PCC 6715 TaxID=1917166 RepID=A0A2D2Q0W6_PARLV|nr:succinyldiaminopimelate aminotransferase [Thermostichus lividus PCC 6715]